MDVGGDQQCSEQMTAYLRKRCDSLLVDKRTVEILVLKGGNELLKHCSVELIGADHESQIGKYYNLLKRHASIYYHQSAFLFTGSPVINACSDKCPFEFMNSASQEKGHHPIDLQSQWIIRREQSLFESINKDCQLIIQMNQGDGPANSPLPTIDDFCRHSLHLYFQTAVAQISAYLQGLQRGSTPKEALNISMPHPQVHYQHLTDQMIQSRTYLLQVYYECLITLKKVDHFWNALPLDETSSPHAHRMNFGNLLKDLVLTIPQISQLTTIKRSHEFKQNKIEQINIKLINLLHETEIYACQILLRILLITFTWEERESYDHQVAKLRRKYIRMEMEGQESMEQSESNMESVRLNKQEKTRNKLLFKQINKIIAFYKCEIFASRTDVKTKIELKCLLQLLNRKLSPDFFNYILQSCDLTQIAYDPYKPEQKCTEPSTERTAKKKLQLCKLDSLTITKQLDMGPPIPDPNVLSPLDPLAIEQHLSVAPKIQIIPEELKESPEISLSEDSPKVKQEQKALLFQTPKKKEPQRMNEQLPKDPLYKPKHSNPPTYNLLIGDKLKKHSFVGMTERFSNRSLFLHKRTKARPTTQAFVYYQRKEQTRPLHNGSKKILTISKQSSNYLKRQESEDSYLADETPVQIKRTYLHYYQTEQ